VKKVSRRAFARDAIAIATAAAVLPNVSAQEAPQTPALAAGAQAEVNARMAWIEGKYASQLSDTQRAEIRKALTGAQAGIEAMRAYPLDNAVEPALPFRARIRGRS
jgi:hypothetical protein